MSNAIATRTNGNEPPAYSVGLCDHCGNFVMSNAIGHVLTHYTEEGTLPCGFICPACDHNYYQPMLAEQADYDPFGGDEE